MLDNLLNRLKYWKRLLTTTKNLYQEKSDVSRWKKKDSLFDNWNERTELMARWIPENSSILEFGAAKLALKQFLPINVRYTPSDIVDRGKGTIVCDLNSDNIPDFKHYDVFFFSGVLEYIFDIPRLLSKLSKSTNRFIISYATIDHFSSTKNRKINGWVNNYTQNDIISIFKENNFKLVHSDSWNRQSIFIFDKISS